MKLLLVLACASDEPAWAVHHASVIPGETGLIGTQTWEFFSERWADEHDPETFLCARAQELTGAVDVALSGCEGCLSSYTLTAAELETDCADPLATDAAYAGAAVAMGIGDVSEEVGALDPYPGRSLGWYVSFDGTTVAPYGFAYDEALDWQGQIGAPGWQNDQTYTLWPAYAWDIR